jgi:hypothetical protein
MPRPAYAAGSLVPSKRGAATHGVTPRRRVGGARVDFEVEIRQASG